MTSDGSWSKTQTAKIVARSADALIYDADACGQFIADALNEKNGWHPIGSGLPEENGKYLATYQLTDFGKTFSENVGIDVFRDGYWCLMHESVGRVIAWRPLPLPYTPDCGGEK